jgi:hypothetical protein
MLANFPEIFTRPEKDLLRTEATPQSNIGDKDQFEFISSCWEDKKTIDEHIESAYRQNRMGCASACRHLSTFKIRLPIFGVIWTQGKVMAHVDWCGGDNSMKSKDTVSALARLYSVHIERYSNIVCIFRRIPWTEAR